MKISVIIPVYNCEEYLPACLDSIVCQTHTDLEIILVNDGSRDNSPAICDAYAQKDARIRVIHQKNQGVSAARNTGLDAATGNWIGFVDSDDTIEPDIYETLLNLALKHDADIAHCGYRKIHFDGTSKAVLGTEKLLVQGGVEACECVLAGKHFTGSPCTKLYRRDLIHTLRFDPDLKINEDILMNIRVFLSAHKLVFWDVPKYHYYERSESATRKTNRLKIKRDCVKATEEMLKLLTNTQAEAACADRLIYALTDLYRTCIFESIRESKEERMQIHCKIVKLRESYGNISARSMWNYRFMRYLPGVYVMVYRMYDKIRTPNIDL